MNSGPYLHTDLANRYSEEHRKYHNLKHIFRMLREFDRVRYMFKNVDEAELAVWYHNIIYDPKRDDNKEKSAEYFKNLALSTHCGLSPVVTRRVVKIILATKHGWVSDNIDARIICDIDLAILGKSLKIFDEYERQIREEYKHVPEENFVKGRIKILERILKRPSIFSTAFFRKKYEEKAVKNLKRSIKRLKRHLQS